MSLPQAQKTGVENLLVELFVEELPPKVLKKLGDAFAGTLAEQLKAMGLAGSESTATAYASPRRLAVHLTDVAARAADREAAHKLMPAAVGLDAAGQATPALLKKLQALGAGADAVARLRRASDGKADILFLDNVLPGLMLAEGLQKALLESIAKLPVPKLMSYQLETGCELPGWSSVSFVRPAHGLVALHGDTVVPVQALGLQAGRATHGHRFEAAHDPIVISHADAYVQVLERDGAVLASFAARRAEIVRQLAAAAEGLGSDLRPIDDAALLDEVSALVERPNVLVCSFEDEFLAVPQECLILTMKANQKYFPLLDGAGKLTSRFLVVSNIRPDDPSAVIAGNERVVRPRLADAKFFFDQDRKRTLESRLPGLAKVVYHNKLGSQGERVARVRAIARAIGEQLGGELLAQAADTAAKLAKADLLTDMVGEFPELQGIMGGYYARHDGLGDDIALAIEDHYRPRFAGDELPRGPAGTAVALADKLETLVGMFAIGNLPSGDKDPFALRRHALGIIRMLVAQPVGDGLDALLARVFAVFDDEALQREFWEAKQAAEHADKLARADGGMVVHGSGFAKRALDAGAPAAIAAFLYERLAGVLREQGYSAQEVDAVVTLRPQRLAEVGTRLAAVRAFAAMPEAPALAAANKRIANILKKSSEGEVGAVVDTAVLHEAAEQSLYAAMQDVLPRAGTSFDAGDYTGALRLLAALRGPVDAFFDSVMVNAEQPELRRNRLALLGQLHGSMNRVADLSRLAA